jgi:hypothetical protein
MRPSAIQRANGYHILGGYDHISAYLRELLGNFKGTFWELLGNFYHILGNIGHIFGNLGHL